jgi:hypothetical protein
MRVEPATGDGDVVVHTTVAGLAEARRTGAPLAAAVDAAGADVVDALARAFDLELAAAP